MTASFSTSEVSSDERIDYWREMVRRHFVPLAIEPLLNDEFDGSVQLRAIGELDVARVKAHPIAVTRARRHIDQSFSEEYFVAVHLRGLAVASQEGRRAVMRPGDVALLDSARPYAIEFHDPAMFDHVIVRVPRARLDARCMGLDRATATIVKAGTDAGRMVSSVMQSLLSLRSGAPYAGPALDLIAAALRQGIGLDAPPLARAERVARELEAYVLSHLGDPGLSPESAARACFVSVRQLHRVFAVRGTTFGELVRTARLRACRRDLADPALATLPVATIAARWGFRSPAHFTRAFGAAFETSPRDFRRERLGS